MLSNLASAFRHRGECAGSKGKDTLGRDAFRWRFQQIAEAVAHADRVVAEQVDCGLASGDQLTVRAFEVAVESALVMASGVRGFGVLLVVAATHFGAVLPLDPMVTNRAIRPVPAISVPSAATNSPRPISAL